MVSLVPGRAGNLVGDRNPDSRIPVDTGGMDESGEGIAVGVVRLAPRR